MNFAEKLKTLSDERILKIKEEETIKEQERLESQKKNRKYLEDLAEKEYLDLLQKLENCAKKTGEQIYSTHLDWTKSESVYIDTLVKKLKNDGFKVSTRSAGGYTRYSDDTPEVYVPSVELTIKW